MLTWSRESLDGLKEYFKIGIPSTFLFSLENFCMELMALLSGVISVKDFVANIITLNVINIAYFFSAGIMSAAIYLVSQAI